MEHEKILERIKEINNNSIELQKAHRISGVEFKDEIGGHIGYDNKEEKSICPSDEFFTSLFEECAAGLGFKYERR